MHQLLFIRLLTNKSESDYRQIYDAYATRLYAFILPLVDNKSMAEKIVAQTYTTLWNEAPVLNLRHPDPFLYLLQKMIAQLTKEKYATDTIRQNILNRVKSLRLEPQLTVVSPHASQHDQKPEGFIPKPSA